MERFGMSSEKYIHLQSVVTSTGRNQIITESFKLLCEEGINLIILELC